MQFQAPQNQQNPSDHDKLETSDTSCHNFQTISKICTANFQIMPESKKRYIIRTYTQGSAPTVQEISGNVLTITASVLTERVFRFWQQFIFFVGEDLRTVILRKLTAYMRPVPIVPSFTRIFIYGSHQKRPATYCNLTSQRKSVQVSVNQHTAQPNASQKAEISDLTAFSTEKSQIRNIKLRFHNI